MKRTGDELERLPIHQERVVVVVNFKRSRRNLQTINLDKLKHYVHDFNPLDCRSEAFVVPEQLPPATGSEALRTVPSSFAFRFGFWAGPRRTKESWKSMFNEVLCLMDSWWGGKSDKRVQKRHSWVADKSCVFLRIRLFHKRHLISVLISQ